MHRPVTLTLRPRRVARTAAAALAGAAAVVALASCSTQSQAQTQVPYIQADGVPANLGAVEASDLLIVAPSMGATGVLSGAVFNNSSSPISVSFMTVADAQGGNAQGGNAQGGNGQGTTIQLAAKQQQQITGVQFANLQASPGSMTGIVLKTSAGQQNVQVPVLLPQGPYATLTAAPASASATTGGATAGAGATTTGAATTGATTTGATTTVTATATGTAATGTPTSVNPTSAAS